MLIEEYLKDIIPHFHIVDHIFCLKNEDLLYEKETDRAIRLEEVLNNPTPRLRDLLPNLRNR